MHLIFFNENYYVLIKILPQFVDVGPFDDKSVLVQIMIWHQTDNQPFIMASPGLSELTEVLS